MAKRPFTTSSLTSTLKSTLASQPLLGNLTNIDKISSQASSLAQKSSFFGAINQQFQQQSQNQSGTGNANFGSKGQRTVSPAVGTNNSGAPNAANSKDMTRDAHHPNAGPSGLRPPVDTTPAVDMSHLTEEERLMIQSVMAKAEMADMGIPVDTSMPSSTNLPSSTSQALTQQRDQQQQQQRQNQQQHNQQQQHDQTSQHQLNQQKQYQASVSGANNLGPGSSQASSMQAQSSNSGVQNDMNQFGNQMQSEPPQSRQAPFQSQVNQSFGNMNTSFDGQTGLMIDNNAQRAMNQAQIDQMQQQNINFVPQSMGEASFVPTTQNQQPSLEQQTRQLISQINSEFNLGGGPNQQQQQLQPQQPQQQQQLQQLQQPQQLQQQQQQQPQLMQPGYPANSNIQQQTSNQTQVLAENGTMLPQQQFAPVTNNQMQTDQLGSMNNRPLYMNELAQPQATNQQSLLNSNQHQQALNQNQMAAFDAQMQGENLNGPVDQMFNMGAANIFGPVEARPDAMQQMAQQTLVQNRVDPYMMGATQPSPGQFGGQTIAADLRMIERANGPSWAGRSFDQMSLQPRLVNRKTIDESALRYGSDQNMTSDFDYEQSFSDHDLDRNSTRNRRRKPGAQASRRHELAREASTSRQRKPIEQQDREFVRRGTQEASTKQKSRQLPQPGCSTQSKKSPSKTSRSLSNDLDNVPTGNTPIKQASRNNSGPPNKNVTKHIKESPVYLTDSDLEENTLSAESSIEKRLPSPANARTKTSDQQPETMKRDSVEKSEAEKSSKALQLLNELKLSEQANQVMKQQQLLIKQSQELIKLQQAQLEQAVGKKTAASRESDLMLQDENRTDSFDSFRSNNKDEPNIKRNGSVIQQSSEPPSTADAEVRVDSGPKLDAERTRIVKDSGTQSGKKTHADLGDFESDSSLIDQRRTKSTSVHSNNLEDIDSANELNLNAQRQSETRRAKQSQTPNSAVSQTLLKRNNRDLLQSPTDTTDSDADLFSQSGRQRRQQKTPTKPKGVQRRREPTGLPPSPLPVAAAIQLHHMQQQHLRQQTSSKPDNLTRANFLRSRSVTSSPNHMLHRFTGGSGGYRAPRPSSPDTMSEFGGMRRRKCLPEPPTNVVPLTPSIVRRLIQAQKAAVASNQNSSQSSYTAQVNPLLERNLAANRLINERVRSSLDALNVKYPSTSSALMDRWNSGESAFGIGSRLPYSSALDRKLEMTNRANMQPFGQASASSFNDPILRSSNIADVKETPELDKLISNLDEYYGLDSGKNIKSATSYKLPDNRTGGSSLLNTSMNTYTGSLVSSPVRRPFQPQSSQYTNYAARPSYQTGLTSSDIMMRRNSEGQARQYPLSYAPFSHTQQNNLDYRPPTYTPMSASNSYRPNVNASAEPYVHPSTSVLQAEYRLSPQKSSSDFAGNSRLDNYSWQRAYNPSPADSAPVHSNQRHFNPNVSRDLNYGQFHGARYPPEAYRATSSQFDNNVDRTQYYHDSIAPAHSSLTHTSGPPTQAGYWNRYNSNMAPLTKDDIINNGPKFSSIGYRFRTENQNKYVTEMRTPIECLQSRYPYPYKRILLSKNPKDRIGNGIGVRIIGGQAMPNVYDQVNKCMVASGAFVTEVFQSSRVHFLNEMHEGDQIIEWNGVNLCNRSDQEVQQILLSQFSDDEVEIIYLNRDKFFEAYGVDVRLNPDYEHNYGRESATGHSFDVFAGLNKQPGDYYGHTRSPYGAESAKRSIRRKLSLSSISHMWSK